MKKSINRITPIERLVRLLDKGTERELAIYVVSRKLVSEEMVELRKEIEARRI